MKTSPSLGEKIKYFRKRAGLSQLALETAIDASPGSISRIESGKVNPTKESLLAMTQTLRLTAWETAYLFEIDTVPTQQEIQRVLDDIKETLTSEKVFGYLINNRAEVIQFTKGFEKFCAKSNLDYKKLIGKSVIEILFNPDLPVRKLVPADKFKEVALPVVAVVIQQRSYWEKEDWWRDALARFKKFPTFEQIWMEVQTNKVDLMSANNRKIYLPFMGFNVEFTYYPKPLYTDPRFAFVEYTPKSKFLKVLSKF